MSNVWWPLKKELKKRKEMEKLFEEVYDSFCKRIHEHEKQLKQLKEMNNRVQ